MSIMVQAHNFSCEVTEFEFGPEFGFARVSADSIWAEIAKRHDASPSRAIMASGGYFWVRLHYRGGMPDYIQGGNSSVFRVCENPDNPLTGRNVAYPAS